MSTQHVHLARLRTRWSAVGAAVAITLGAGGLSMAQAAIDTGDRPVTVSIASERILDTRTNLGLAGRFADATPRDIQVTGSVPVASGGNKTVVPADAIGVLVNVTVVSPSHEGFLSLRPEGAAGEPTTSTVNFFPGAIEPNGATVDLNNGKVQIWVETSSDSGSADVLIDVVGYTIGHTHDDRYYTEGESDTAVAAAVAPKANSADVYTKAEADAAHTANAAAADVYTGTLANDAFVRFVQNTSFSLEDKCSDADGCRVTLIRELGGTRYLYGPITFQQIQGGQWWTFAGGTGGSAADGTSANSGTQVILGSNAGSSYCYLSDWDSSGNTGNGDQNANFAGVHFNSTATVQTCTIKIED